MFLWSTHSTRVLDTETQSLQLFPETQSLSERESFLCKNEQFLINQVILEGQGNLFHLDISKGAVCTPHVYTVSCLVWQYGLDSKHTMK